MNSGCAHNVLASAVTKYNFTWVSVEKNSCVKSVIAHHLPYSPSPSQIEYGTHRLKASGSIRCMLAPYRTIHVYCISENSVLDNHLPCPYRIPHTHRLTASGSTRCMPVLGTPFRMLRPIDESRRWRRCNGKKSRNEGTLSILHTLSLERGRGLIRLQWKVRTNGGTLSINHNLSSKSQLQSVFVFLCTTLGSSTLPFAIESQQDAFVNQRFHWNVLSAGSEFQNLNQLSVVCQNSTFLQLHLYRNNTYRNPTLLQATVPPPYLGQSAQLQGGVRSQRIRRVRIVVVRVVHHRTAACDLTNNCFYYYYFCSDQLRYNWKADCTGPIPHRWNLHFKGNCETPFDSK